MKFWEYKKSARITLAVTYVFTVLLIAVSVALPWLITWYAETMGRSERLAATVMLTCYPLAPFGLMMLHYLRTVIKNILKGDILTDANIKALRKVSWCCLIAGVIMLIAGIFYIPFYIASAAALVCALISRVFKNMLHFMMEQKYTPKSEEEK